MVTQDITMAKLTCIFAKDENMDFFFKTTANLSYDQKLSPFHDLTNISHDSALEPCTKTKVCMCTIHKLHH